MGLSSVKSVIGGRCHQSVVTNVGFHLKSIVLLSTDPKQSV